MVRAPDAYVYPAPFNLVETFFVAPLEFVHSGVPPTRLANESFLQILFEPISLRKGKSGSTLILLACRTPITAQPFCHECPVLHPYDDDRTLRVILAEAKMVE